MAPNSYQKRKSAELELQQTKDLEKQIKGEIKEKTIAVHRQQQANKERRDLNKVKSGQYQIIKDTTKIRKYDKKARTKVMKMSSEMIEALVSRKTQEL